MINHGIRLLSKSVDKLNFTIGGVAHVCIDIIIIMFIQVKGI